MNNEGDSDAASFSDEEGLALEDEEDGDGDTNADEDNIDGFRNNLKVKLEKFMNFFSSSKEATDVTEPSSNSPSIDKFNDGMSVQPVKVFESESNVYDFNHRHRGLALIINNENFSKKSKLFSDRPGSSVDAQQLVKTFKRLGFHVVLYQNLTAIKILEVLHLVSRDYKHSLADCFVCVVLSHGHEIQKELLDGQGSRTTFQEDVICGVDGKVISTQKILEYFNDYSCPDLQDKPRLFFFQACRGTEVDDGVDIRLTKNKKSSVFKHSCVDAADSSMGSVTLDTDDVATNVNNEMFVEVDAKTSPEKSEGKLERQCKLLTVISPASLHKDFLVMYATPPGYYSWRRASGTWFIQSLCQVLGRRDIRKTSLVRALLQVNQLVAVKYESNITSDLSMHKKKEMPLLQSMLVKDIVFTKKKVMAAC